MYGICTMNVMYMYYETKIFDQHFNDIKYFGLQVNNINNL